MGLDLQRQEPEQHAQPRRTEGAHDRVADAHCPGAVNQNIIDITGNVKKNQLEKKSKNMVSLFVVVLFLQNYL